MMQFPWSAKIGHSVANEPTKKNKPNNCQFELANYVKTWFQDTVGSLSFHI